jgi:hypothetical protein
MAPVKASQRSDATGDDALSKLDAPVSQESGMTWQKKKPALACASDPSKQAPNFQRVLARASYFNTMHDLFGDDALTTVQAYFATIPPEDNAKDKLAFDSAGAALSTDHVAAYASIADVAASYLVESGERAKLLAPCMVDLGKSSFSESCVSTFLGGFATRIFRRPLTDAEKTAYLGLYRAASPATSPSGMKLLLSALLQSRPFLYLFEDGTELAGKPVDVLKLTPFELASRLSYFLWNSLPDDALFAAAADGSIREPTVLEAQARRMLADPKAKTAMRRFYEKWLGIESNWQANYSTAFADGIETTNLPAAAADELYRFLDDVTWNQKGSWNDVLTSRTAFVSDPELAKVYGVSAEPVGMAQQLPATQRAGLLTRVALLKASGDEYAPIARGARIAKKVLCLHLESPPGNAVADAQMALAAIDHSKPFREKTAAVTKSAGCSGCHSLVNPLGFALGNFDSMGRFSANERHFIDGVFLNEVKVDAAVKVPIGAHPDVTIKGGAELSDAIASTPEASECFAMNMFQYQVGRFVASGDSCAVQRAVTAMNRDGGGIVEAIVSLVLEPTFATRRVGDKVASDGE